MGWITNIYDNCAPWMIEKLGYLLNPFILNFKIENSRLLVFYFHGLFESSKQKQLNHVDPQNNITVNQFVVFIEYFLQHGYNFIKPEDLDHGLIKDRRYAMITFDDGYFNNILVLEILRKFDIPAVLFITTKNVQENKSFWWDIIYKFRSKQGNSIEKIRDEQRSLKLLKFPVIDDYVTRNFGAGAFKPLSDIDRPFNELEISHLSLDRNVSIGNHTHNHSILINYSREEIREELTISNDVLFGITGKYPVSVAFPNGNYNDMVLEATDEAGFRYAFTTEARKNHLPVEKARLICLDRYNANPATINTYGGFYRMGYEPELLSEEIKTKIKSLLSK